MTAMYASKYQAPTRPAKPSAFIGANQARNQQKIKEIADERGIPFLVHFTQAENLPGILQHGIVSRKQAELLEINLYVTDKHRFDNRLDATSLSVAFPNGPMFYRKREQAHACNWVVLLLDPRVLWEKDCAFYHANAASNQMRYASHESLKSAEALEGMFYPCAKREQEGLHSYDPTDVQAEVMVSDIIEPEYISAAVFQDNRVMKACTDLFAGMDVGLGVQSLGLFGLRAGARR